MIRKLFFYGEDNQSCSSETWRFIELKTQMNSPCSDTINHLKRGRNSSGEVTLRPRPQIAFHYVLHLCKPDIGIKVALKVMARSFSNSPNAHHRLGCWTGTRQTWGSKQELLCHLVCELFLQAIPPRAWRCCKLNCRAFRWHICSRNT